MTRRAAAALAFTLLTGGVHPAWSQAPTPAAPAAAPAKNDYAGAASWLCRPGRQDACAVDLTTTVVAANGTLTCQGKMPISA